MPISGSGGTWGGDGWGSQPWGGNGPFSVVGAEVVGPTIVFDLVQETGGSSSLYVPRGAIAYIYENVGKQIVGQGRWGMIQGHRWTDEPGEVYIYENVT